MAKIILEVERPRKWGIKRAPEQKRVVVKKGDTIYDLLRRGALPTEGLNISINGEPVSSLDMRVADGARIRLGRSPVEKPERIIYQDRPVRVSYTERATGS